MNTCKCGRRIEDRSTRCPRCAALHELGLEDGATESEIKDSYRAHVKAWHPDRYLDDNRQQRAAELKLKKVNAAYRLLTTPEEAPEFVHQAAGESASTQASRWREEASAPGSVPGGNSNWEQPVTIKMEDQDAESVRQVPSGSSRGPRIFLLYALLFVVVIGGTYFLNLAQLKSSILHPANPSSASIPVAAGTASNSQPPQGPPAVPEFFTLGSPKTDVIAVQGQPTAQEPNMLHYGLSTVSLQNDQVVGWKVFPLNPLKVILRPHSLPPSESSFTVGSSKDEVIALEGTPTAISDNTFSYGKSTVTFEDDKVSTWAADPANPLHIRR